MIKDKYNMTLKENLFLVHKMIVDYIWKSANLEGINVTFPQTQTIIEKGILQNANVHTISVVLNLKHAWQLLLSTINDPLTLEYICKIHSEVAKDEALTWGELRTGRVGISGTNYEPPIPNEQTAKKLIEDTLKIENSTQRAITLMFKLMKSQLFWDGNKRTAMMIANKIMIENGCGVINVPIEQIDSFNTVLTDYYTNDTLDNVVHFIYDNCIDGIDFEDRNIENKAAILDRQDNPYIPNEPRAYNERVR